MFELSVGRSDSILVTIWGYIFGVLDQARKNAVFYRHNSEENSELKQSAFYDSNCLQVLQFLPQKMQCQNVKYLYYKL